MNVSVTKATARGELPEKRANRKEGKKKKGREEERKERRRRRERDTRKKEKAEKMDLNIKMTFKEAQ